MDLTQEQIRAMAQASGLDIPQQDLENVRLRLSGLLAEMATIEQAIGREMDKVDPVPPVYPHDEFTD